MSTTPTPQQVQALEKYCESISFAADFIPESDYEQAAGLMLDAAAASPDQTPAGRQKAAGTALHDAVVAKGYASEVTADQCLAAAGAMLQSA
jgi:hypothetical protein